MYWTFKHWMKYKIHFTNAKHFPIITLAFLHLVEVEVDDGELHVPGFGVSNREVGVGGDILMIFICEKSYVG